MGVSKYHAAPHADANDKQGGRGDKNRPDSMVSTYHANTHAEDDTATTTAATRFWRKFLTDETTEEGDEDAGETTEGTEDAGETTEGTEHAGETTEGTEHADDHKGDSHKNHQGADVHKGDSHKNHDRPDSMVSKYHAAPHAEDDTATTTAATRVVRLFKRV